MKSALSSAIKSYVRVVFGVIIVGALLQSCASVPRIQSDDVPEGSLRLAQAVYLASKSEVLESKELQGILVSSGINKTEVKDGSVILARTYCCGGPNEQATARMVYVPSTISVEVGDIIELKTGHTPKNGDRGALNTVTRIVQKIDDNRESCRWDPPDERLWQRVLYCDWMEGDGWIKQEGITPAWFKPTQ